MPSSKKRTVKLKVITLGLTQQIVDTLDRLKELKLINSRSEAVREMIDYCFPYFLGLKTMINLITSKKWNPYVFKKPQYIELNQLQPNTLEDLRKLFPNQKEYKFINEE